VLGELVAHRGANFVIALAAVAVGGCEALSMSQAMILLMSRIQQAVFE
jgi:hypothetical protein